MNKTLAQISLLALVSVSVVPFLNVMRYAPMPDWGSNASAVLLLTLAALASLIRPDSKQAAEWQLPPFVPLATAWWLLVFAPYSSLHQGLLPLSEMSATLLAIVAAGLLASHLHDFSRAKVVGALAWAILLGGVLQSAIALLQLLQLAELANGWLMYTASHDIIGNISQRNQLAHVLTWSGLATAYLWQSRQLGTPLALVAMVLFATVIAWSGGRLSVAYALAILSLTVLLGRSEQGRGLGLKLALWAGLILLMQFLGPKIATLLTGIESSSGLSRLFGEGFGERRRVEWQKAWLIAGRYPWFGVGFGEWGYYSTWLEAFGGFAKIPEGSLFTHSHNLVFQLLAETGWPATLLAASTVFYCLWPYLLPRNHSPENAFLLLLAVVMLVHSMFEYPLWYLPFLVVFFFVLVLSPRQPVTLQVRSSMRRGGQLVLVILAAVYLITAYPTYKSLLDAQRPSPDAKQNAANVEQIFVAARHPYFVFESELALSNYLVPTASDVKVKLHHYEEMVRYRPYPALLTNLAILRALSGDASGADEAITMAIAAYPVNLPVMLLALSQYKEHAILPLRQKVMSALQTYQQSGAAAAAASVASSRLDRPLP